MTLSLHNRHSVDVIYFDFAKAFDFVTHPKLLNKLRAYYGFCGDLLRIFSDFLQDRTQRVVLPNGASTFCSVISGVPRGSVRACFISRIYRWYCQDLFENTIVCTNLYADDIKIYLEIACNTDHTTLQDRINKIYSWSKTWQLKLASNKCQHNRITLSSDASTNDDYSLSDVLLPTVNNEVAVLGFSFWGPLGGDTFIWGHTTNTFALNYRVCNRLYQIINT